MATAEENRRGNLAILVREKAGGNAAKLAREIGGKTPETYLRNILNLERNMGAPLARRIERKFGLPTGGMDAPNLGRAQTESEDKMKTEPNVALMVFREFTSPEQAEAIRHIFELRKRQPGEKRG